MPEHSSNEHPPLVSRNFPSRDDAKFEMIILRFYIWLMVVSRAAFWRA
jgi:hypothetical protein